MNFRDLLKLGEELDSREPDDRIDAQDVMERVEAPSGEVQVGQVTQAPVRPRAAVFGGEETPYSLFSGASQDPFFTPEFSDPVEPPQTFTPDSSVPESKLAPKLDLANVVRNGYVDRSYDETGELSRSQLLALVRAV